MSKEKKYTPGPWWHGDGSTLDAPEGVVRGGDNELVASCTGRSSTHDDGLWDRQLANARLIAAAPELLEALEEAEWVLQGTVNAGRNTIADDRALIKIRAAIAKALGE